MFWQKHNMLWIKIRESVQIYRRDASKRVPFGAYSNTIAWKDFLLQSSATISTNLLKAGQAASQISFDLISWTEQINISSVSGRRRWKNLLPVHGGPPDYMSSTLLVPDGVASKLNHNGFFTPCSIVSRPGRCNDSHVANGVTNAVGVQEYSVDLLGSRHLLWIYWAETISMSARMCSAGWGGQRWLRSLALGGCLDVW
jgi:hypothetical protein